MGRKVTRKASSLNFWRKGGGSETSSLEMQSSSMSPAMTQSTRQAKLDQSQFSGIPSYRDGGEAIGSQSAWVGGPGQRDPLNVRFQYNFMIGILVGALTISLLGNQGLWNIFNIFFRNVIEIISNLGSHISYTAGTLLNTTSNVAANTAITSIELVDGATNELGDIFRDVAANNTTPIFRQTLDSAQNISEKPFLPRHLGAYPYGEHSAETLPLVQKHLQIDNKSRDSEDRQSLDNVINNNTQHSGSNTLTFRKPPKSDDGAVSAIQGPIRASNPAFCFIGNMDGERGCVQVNSGDICNSGVLFSTRDNCENNTHNNGFPGRNPAESNQ
jgi:hypothetical protein